MKRVVVTGMGVVSPVGNNTKDTWNNVLAGKTGVDIISSFDSTDLPVRIAAEVKDFDPLLVMTAKEAQRNPRFIQFSLLAAHEALSESHLRQNTNPERFGCCIGVGLGSIRDIEENSLLLRDKGARRISPFFIPLTIANMASGLVAEKFKLKGPNMCTTTACASGTHAIGEGFRYIKDGYADVMVCGGAESTITPLTIAAFAAMKALSRRNDDPKRASKPFDLDRDGFVMGEGAGILILEEHEHAVARGATIYAEMLGYGLSGDAYHITSPAPNAEGGQRCMKMALGNAGLSPDKIDYINAHGTSTKLNDEYETIAISKVFGEHAQRLVVSSTKGSTGHCIGAAGGIEAALTIKALSSGIIPPTINYETSDPNCFLDYCPNDPRQVDPQFAMSNSFGFGGINSSIIFSRYLAG